MITFEIPGRIQPKQRPRFSKGHTYTPKKTMDYEKHVKQSYPYDLMMTGQLKIKIIIYYEVPKSASKALVEEMLAHNIRPTGRHYGDLDNGIKTLLDALNGVTYEDDSQVVEIIARRYFGEYNKVVVTLEEA